MILMCTLYSIVGHFELGLILHASYFLYTVGLQGQNIKNFQESGMDAKESQQQERDHGFLQTNIVHCITVIHRLCSL